MKHTFFLLSFFIFNQLAFSQENGLYEQFYDNGQLKVFGQYQNKQKVGPWKEYFENGKLKREYSYTKGKKNKESKHYFESGGLKSETIEIADSKTEHKEYFESGQLYYQRILPSGYYKEYYNTGELKTTCNYNKKDIVGVWNLFFKTGTVEYEVAYKNGYKDGVYKQYYPSGKLRATGNHTLDKKNGVEIYYDESGQEINTIKYKKGVLKSTKNKSLPVEIPEGAIHNVPIYPGCEKFLGNNLKTTCMSKFINTFFQENFNKKLITKYGIPKGKKVKILVFFTINRLGKVENIKAKSALPSLTNEAMRVCHLLPKMTPGQIKGKTVDMPFSLPLIINAL